MYCCSPGSAVPQFRKYPHLEDKRSLLPLQRERSGMLAFKHYFRILELSHQYRENEFLEKKRECIKNRRRALANSDENKYESIVLQMMQ